MDNKKIAGFITELRKANNLTQKELADKLHITDKAVSKWERGQSYPDITILPQLCAQLGVTVTELLNGERAAEGEASAVNVEHMVETTLNYAQQATKQQRFSKKGIALMVVTLTFLLAVFVCSLCDFVITGGFGWSLYVTGSVVLAWCIIAPLLYGEKLRFVLALAALTVLIFPFLALVQWVSGSAGWLIPLGLPASLAGIAYLWVIVSLFTFTRINRWFIAAVGAFLAPLLDVFIDSTITGLMGKSVRDPSALLTLIAALTVGLGLCAAGIVTRRRSNV